MSKSQLGMDLAVMATLTSAVPYPSKRLGVRPYHGTINVIYNSMSFTFETSFRLELELKIRGEALLWYFQCHLCLRPNLVLN